MVKTEQNISDEQQIDDAFVDKITASARRHFTYNSDRHTYRPPPPFMTTDCLLDRPCSCRVTTSKFLQLQGAANKLQLQRHLDAASHDNGGQEENNKE